MTTAELEQILDSKIGNLINAMTDNRLGGTNGVLATISNELLGLSKTQNKAGKVVDRTRGGGTNYNIANNLRKIRVDVGSILTEVRNNLAHAAVGGSVSSPEVERYAREENDIKERQRQIANDLRTKYLDEDAKKGTTNYEFLKTMSDEDIIDLPKRNDMEKSIREKAMLEKEQHDEEMEEQKKRFGQYSKYFESLISSVSAANSQNSAGATGKIVSQVGGAVAGMIKNPMVSAIVEGTSAALKAVFDIINENQKAGQSYARTVGGGRNAMNVVQMRAGQAAAEQGVFDSFNITAKEIMESYAELQNGIGRVTSQSNEAMLHASVLMKQMGVTASQFDKFDTFGYGVERVNSTLGKIYADAAKNGLSYKKTSEAVNQNIKMASNYTFRKGLNDFIKMAEQSTAIKMNMQQVANLADKASTLEGALDVSANLSVLGGQFAQFSNPLSLLNESLNDVGSLQDRISGMMKGKAYFDQENGEMAISAFDRYRLKESAKAMGIDPSNFIESVLNQGRQERILQQANRVSSLSNGNFASDEDREKFFDYLKNTATLDSNGNAFVSIKDKMTGKMTEKSINDLKSEDISSLKESFDIKTQPLTEVAESTKTLDDNVHGILVWLKTRLTGILTSSWFFDDPYEEAVKNGDRDTISKMDDDEIKAAATKISKQRTTRAYWEGIGVGGAVSLIPGLGLLGAGIGGGLIGTAEATENSRIKDIIDQTTKIRDEENASKQKAAFGLVPGPKHSEGGVQATYAGKPLEIEGGESIINAKSTRKYGSILRDINEDRVSIRPAGSTMAKHISGEGGGTKDSGTRTLEVKVPTINLKADGQIDLNAKGNNAGKIGYDGIDWNDSMLRTKLANLIYQAINEGVNKGFDQEHLSFGRYTGI